MRKGTITPLAVPPESATRAQAQFPKLTTRTLPQTVVVLATSLAPLLLPAEIVSAQTFQGYYQLQTELLEGESRCLEGNKVDPSSTLGGAAFMDLCRHVRGQLWKIDSAEEPDYDRLRTMLLGSDKCLEGNRIGGNTLGGAAFMDTCKSGVSGQLWRIVPLQNGYHQLQTKFMGDRCLEGNSPGGKTLQGTAFMDRCQSNAAGLRCGDEPVHHGVPEGGVQRLRSVHHQR